VFDYATFLVRRLFPIRSTVVKIVVQSSACGREDRRVLMCLIAPLTEFHDDLHDRRTLTTIFATAARTLTIPTTAASRTAQPSHRPTRLPLNRSGSAVRCRPPASRELRAALDRVDVAEPALQPGHDQGHDEEQQRREE
jgi:hypothetical protein